MSKGSSQAGASTTFFKARSNCLAYRKLYKRKKSAISLTYISSQLKSIIYSIKHCWLWLAHIWTISHTVSTWQGSTAVVQLRCSPMFDWAGQNAGIKDAIQFISGKCTRISWPRTGGKHEFQPRTLYGSRPFLLAHINVSGTSTSFGGGDIKSANNIFELGTMAARAQKSTKSNNEICNALCHWFQGCLVEVVQRGQMEIAALALTFDTIDSLPAVAHASSPLSAAAAAAATARLSSHPLKYHATKRTKQFSLSLSGRIVAR